MIIIVAIDVVTDEEQDRVLIQRRGLENNDGRVDELVDLNEICMIRVGTYVTFTDETSSKKKVFFSSQLCPL